MKNAILIVEMCSEGSIQKLCDYDSLPEKTKTKVDQAIKSEKRDAECNIYEYGIQYLMDYIEETKAKIFIEPGEECKYMGEVTLYYFP
jgi:hypothetical protein